MFHHDGLFPTARYFVQWDDNTECLVVPTEIVELGTAAQAFARFARFLVRQHCLDCDRVCVNCRYEIPGGWEHITVPQPIGGSHVVCTLERVRRPLVERLDGYLTHKTTHLWDLPLVATNET